MDGSFEAKASNDNGQSWTTLELVSENANAWTQVGFDLESFLPLTQQMRFRFTACDPDQPTLVEALVDDLVITSSWPTSGAGESAGSPSLLAPISPNPFTGRAGIRLHLPQAARVTLTVSDISGRRVRLLFSGSLDGGPHEFMWDGHRDGGDRAAAGLYFCDLRGAGLASCRKVLLLK